MRPRCIHRGNGVVYVDNEYYWDSSFNEAAVYSPRKRQSVHPRLAMSRCFNEAAVYSPRKPKYSQEIADRLCASMRPRCIHRGNSIQCGNPSPRYTCFNEAAVYSPRKLTRLDIHNGTNYGFNEAAVYSPRKRARLHFSYSRTPSLQ